MTPLISRLAAVALLAATLAGVGLGVVLPAVRAHHRLAEQVATAREQLSAFRAAGPRPAEGAAPPGRPLDADDPALAAAALQRRLDAVVAAAGGARLSARVHDPEPQDGGRRVAVTLEVEGDTTALRDMLHAVETAPGPTLFVEWLEVRAARDQGDADAPRRLLARLTVSGVMRTDAAAERGAGRDAL